MSIEDWFKKKLQVPDNWDKFDYEMQRYSFNDLVDFAEQYYHDKINTTCNNCTLDKSEGYGK